MPSESRTASEARSPRVATSSYSAINSASREVNCWEKARTGTFASAQSCSTVVFA